MSPSSAASPKAQTPRHHDEPLTPSTHGVTSPADNGDDEDCDGNANDSRNASASANHGAGIDELHTHRRTHTSPNINPHSSSSTTPTPAPPSASASAASKKNGVRTLSDAQLSKKRANDREAQRAIRERTKKQIEGLEQRIRDLESGEAFRQLQEALKAKGAVEVENAELRGRFAQVVEILRPLVGAGGVSGIGGGGTGAVGSGMGGEMGSGMRIESGM